MAKRKIISGTISQSETREVKSFADLTYGERQKVDYLCSVYNNDETTLLKLIQCMEYRGRNSWASVNQKLDLILNATREQQRYIDALYDSFEVNKQYTTNDIVQIVGNVRRSIGLPPYMARIRTNCTEDFFNLFLAWDTANTITIGDEVQTYSTGFTPLFKLKPEDN